MSDVTIIVPIKVADLRFLEGFAECYQALLRSESLRGRLQLVVANDSPPHIFATVNEWFADEAVDHFRPDVSFMTGMNNKMNSIHAAVQHVTREYALVLDDDYRPSPESVCAFIRQMERGKYSFMKSMVVYRKFFFTDLIYSCGIFICNLVHRQREFCGHFGFRTTDLRKIGFPPKDGLFDELTFENHFIRNGQAVGYADDVYLEMVTQGKRKFLEQRVRYAYEYLAHPKWFVTFLLLLPTILVAVVWAPPIAVLLALGITLICWVIALWGQLRFGRGRFPRLTWLLGPVWFWIFPFTSWLALVHRFRGGYPFGGRLVKNPV